VCPSTSRNCLSGASRPFNNSSTNIFIVWA
jgi:hypothetical protein